MSRRAPLFLPTLALLIALSARSAGAGAWSLAPGEYYTQLQTSVFSTTHGFDDNGKKYAFNGDTKLEERSMETYTELGWKHHTSFLMALPMLNSTLRLSNGTYLPAATGFGDITLGFRQRIFQQRAALAVELDWQTPTGYNRKLRPALGSGFQQFDLALQLGSPVLRSGFVQASIGYGYSFLSLGGGISKDKNPNQQTTGDLWSFPITTSADAGFWMGPRLFLGGRYQGLTTASQGDSTLNFSTYTAGPIVLYRVDDHLDLRAGSWTSFSGRQTLAATQMYVGIVFRQTRLDQQQGFLGGARAR